VETKMIAICALIPLSLCFGLTPVAIEASQSSRYVESESDLFDCATLSLFFFCRLNGSPISLRRVEMRVESTAGLAPAWTGAYSIATSDLTSPHSFL
jgi:hypothetical protein